MGEYMPVVARLQYVNDHSKKKTAKSSGLKRDNWDLAGQTVSFYAVVTNSSQGGARSHEPTGAYENLKVGEAVTDANGAATFNFQSPTTKGSFIVGASYRSPVTGEIVYSVDTGRFTDGNSLVTIAWKDQECPARLNSLDVSVSNTSVSVPDRVQLSVIVLDALNNPLPGVFVQFTANNSLQATAALSVALSSATRAAASSEDATGIDLELEGMDAAEASYSAPSSNKKDAALRSLSGLYSQDSTWWVTTNASGIATLTVGSFSPGTVRFKVVAEGALNSREDFIDITWAEPADDSPTRCVCNPGVVACSLLPCHYLCSAVTASGA
jgi:hypothetical protein